MFYKELKDGLIVRQAVEADLRAIVDLNHKLHDDGHWTETLANGSHPTTKISDFFVVEDCEQGRIVSTTCLIPQIWSYGGVSFAVGRPDLVGTDPEYRRRGLVRELFNMVHAHSEHRGHLVQAIVGRPWFYRQFGYTIALPYGGSLLIAAQDIPELQPGEAEPFHVRAATAADAGVIRRVYDQNREDSLISCVREDRLWIYEMLERGNLDERILHRIIEDERGEAIGWILHMPKVMDGEFVTFMAEALPHVSWLRLGPTLLRYLLKTGQTLAEAQGERLRTLSVVGEGHPLHHVLPEALTRTEPPYAWYLRVQDLPGFLRVISPVLEQRLVDSLCRGYSGELAISFYQQGLIIAFQDGRITDIRGLPFDVRTDARMPLEDFIKLLFGYRSLAELHGNYPEVSAVKQAKLLLEALFPKRRSRILSVC